MIGLLALIYWLAWMATAEAVPIIAAAITAIGVTGSVTIGSTAITYASVLATAIVTAASVGLSLLMAPKADGGGKGQVTVRQSRPARVRGYGRYKLAGAQAFLEADRRFLHRILIHCEGPIDAIEQTWLNDKQITLSGSGAVKINETAPWSGTNVLVVETKTGSATQTASQLLRGLYDGFTNFGTRWTADHRLLGLCYTVIRARAPTDPKIFGRVFPNGMPDLTVVARLSQVYDPRTDTTAWSDNSSLCILDYLTHQRGMVIPQARMDMDSFSAFADVCDTAISLKAGGAEPRYRLSGMYDLTEEPREVLRRMLQTCDAEIYMTPAGKVAIRGGVWDEPKVTITERNIRAFTYEQGNDALAAFNRVTLSFNSPAHGYEVTETEEWNDEASQALSGVVKPQDLSLVMVPAHGQARRLAKIMTAKGNPRHKLTIQTDMAGLDVLGERIIRVVLSELDIDDTFLVTRFEILGDLLSCSIDIVSLAASAYAWNAATEEGDPPPIPQSVSNPLTYDTPPLPTGLALTLLRTEISPGIFALRISAVVDEPAAGWGAVFQYRIEGVGAGWETMAAGDTPWEGRSEILEEGQTYEVQAAHVGSGGSLGTFTATETIDAVADLVAPDSPTDLAVLASAGTATVEWLNPNSANYHATRVYRGATAVFADATLIATRYGAANAFDLYVDPVAAGTYYWWVVAINSSSVPSAEVGPVTDTVT
ncbi:MAG: phage tail protein [Beijerinckiaceae bacterium]|nr:phage tail protein [Beijerinckiaceae bacterium]